ncbi:MAG: DUF3408 domain-containing protein [Dysgonomonas sp.]
MGKKNVPDNIDEKSLLASIYAKKNPMGNITPKVAQQVPEEEVEDEEIKESPLSKEKGGRKKRKESDDYKGTFLKKKELKTRQCVYISLDVHEKIQKIVRFFANQEVSVGGYIDTVLLEHLETNKDEINELYRKFKEQDDKIL